MKNLTPEELQNAYSRLPRPVRTYLASTKLYDFAQEAGQKYSLHVDVVGVLSGLISYMLCGLINPVQFQTALGELKIPDAAADGIVHDLNEKIFKPLRDEIRNAPPEEPEEIGVPAPPPVQAPAPVPTTPLQAPMPVPIKPPPPPPPALFVNTAPPVVAQPVQVPQPVPQAMPAQYIPPQTQAPAAFYTPAPAAKPAPPSWTMPAPTAPTPVASQPIPQTPPAPQAAPSAPRSPQTIVPKSSGRQELQEVLKKYGVDPYRETPE